MGEASSDIYRDKVPVVGEKGVANRRSFIARSGLAVLGLSVGAAAKVSEAKAKASTAYAVTDGPNTFVADQTVLARLGVGRSPQYPLHVVRPGAGAAVMIEAHTLGLAAYHDTDWAGQTYDLVNLYHKSTGDGIFIAHQGGKPPGYTEEVGGNAGLNVLVPYYLDDTTTGRHGTILNDRTGMRAVAIETQATTDGVFALHVRHFSNAYAAFFIVQPPGYGQPVGTGGGIQIVDYSRVSSINISKWTAPNAGEAIVSLAGINASPIDAIRVADNAGVGRLTARTDGRLRILDTNGWVQFEANSDGKLAVGSNIRFAVGFQTHMTTSGVARTAAFVNRDPSVGSGVQIEFDDDAAQYALMTSTFDNRTAGTRSSTLRFSVRSADVMTERIRLDGSGIGFFGANPVARPVVNGSRAGNPALQSLLNALASLGLITDSSTQ